MRLLLSIVLLLTLAACAAPQSGGARECINDTGICYFPGDPNAPTNPYARR